MKFYSQYESRDCGPTCLKMILRHIGKKVDHNYLIQLCNTNRSGTSIRNMIKAAEELNLKTTVAKVNINQVDNILLPAIAFINESHYVIIYKIIKDKIWIADPAIGKYTIKISDFSKIWKNEKTTGIVLLLEPSPLFNNKRILSGNIPMWKRIIENLKKFKGLYLQILMGMVAIIGFQFIYPFFGQYIVDKGVNSNNITIIYLLLGAQLLYFIGRVFAEFIQARILLFISARFSISIVSDFFAHLMKLAISFFDLKLTGDIIQRINDHRRIESFIMYNILEFLLSSLTFIVFSVLFFIYNPLIFFIFIAGSIFQLLWIGIFLKKRKILDYERFEEMSKESSIIFELINGMQELKLHNAEFEKKKRWEKTKVNLYKITEKSFLLNQYQHIGGRLINEFKNILINGITVFAVIDGQMTLGMMFSIIFILGQLNSPIQVFINFMFAFQDTKIALERISVIYNNKQVSDDGVESFTTNSSIKITNLSFSYRGDNSPTLNNININIPFGKKVAIVGKSGSGKTTLVKLMLQFYEEYRGNIFIDDIELKKINSRVWKNYCGTVMQEGYIFNDSILNNITMTEDVESVDKKQLSKAIELANIQSEIEALPMKLETIIGAEGKGLSLGQKQRLLIARAIYKNPEIVFMDEATSALDAENEHLILHNLKTFLAGKTTITVAHRLSSIIDSDIIIVMEKGTVVEQGTHNDLITLKGYYYHLIQKQLF